MIIHFSLHDSKLHCVTPRLYFGDITAGHQVSPDMAVVHACKEPCHKNAVGYVKQLDDEHPHYLSYEHGMHLFLNMIDPPVPLFKHASFKVFFEFVDRQIAQCAVVIHCNQGRSRAPSLALLYMAKRLQLLPNTDYHAARCAFEAQFPYSPSKGIETFLRSEWDALGV
jgi:predicted protein tyrosine phosphatase